MSSDESVGDDTDYDHADPDHADQLHHVELYVDDLDRALDFWGWLLGELGYEEKRAWGSGRSWLTGSTYVVLVEASGDDPAFDRHAPGLNHLAFHASSREQIDQLTSAVRDRDDAAVLYADRHPYAGGYYALYCEAPEPDGLKVEIVGPTE